MGGWNTYNLNIDDLAIYNEVLKGTFYSPGRMVCLLKHQELSLFFFQWQNQPKEQFKTNLVPLFPLEIDLVCCVNCADLLYSDH